MYQFTSLSRYAPYLITPDSERIWRLVEGLRPNIYALTGVVDLPTFEDHVKKAFWAEETANRVAEHEL